MRLSQNETMFIYRIPIDMECTKFKELEGCVNSSSMDDVILLLKKREAEFRQNFNMIDNIFKESIEFVFGKDDNLDFLNFYLRRLAKNENYLISDYKKMI